MIAKAPARGRRGRDTHGLLRYLFGRGKANEHANPHLIGAWDPEWLAQGAFADALGQRGGLSMLARDIDAAMTGHDVHVETGHVYHVALSLPPDDGELGDATWQALVNEAVEHMGFGPDSDGAAGCRWVAVHHGLSAEGNDHVHLVVNLVCGDGTIANTYRDWPRWREWCRKVEDRLGLTPTAPSGEGAAKAISRAELERAKAAARRPEREELRRIVSGAAVAASDEWQFVDLIRASGALIAPQVSGERVTGYRVALVPADEGMAEPLWFAGSSLRRDLSLPRLRIRWDKRIPDRFVIPVWLGEVEVEPVPMGSSVNWRGAARLLREAEAEVRQELAAAVTAPDWHRKVAETADLVAVLASVDRHSSTLLRVHRQLVRAGQAPRGSRSRKRAPGVGLPLLVQAARLAALTRDPAPVVFAGVVLALYLIVAALDQYAQQHKVRASARHQMAVAFDQLKSHPVVRATVPPVPAGSATTSATNRQLPGPKKVSKPTSRKPPVDQHGSKTPARRTR